MGILNGEDWNPSTQWITDSELLRWVRPRLGFRSRDAEGENSLKWLQIDLGSPFPIDAVRLDALRTA